MFSLFKRKFFHLNKITISCSALVHNYHLIQNENPQALICPVLKSNAYGHGLSQVAPIFDSLKPPFICVDSMYEAWKLQALGIESPILILGFTMPENFKVKPLPFHVPLFDLDTAAILNKYQKGIKVHLKIDTGMSRFGIRIDQLDGFLAKLREFKHIRIVGVYSHFSNADNKDCGKTLRQIEIFKDAIHMLSTYGFNPQYKHISASAGAFVVKDPLFNLVRTGITLYGIPPMEIGSNNFRPALEFCSHICQVKHIKKGDTISYGDTFVAPKDMTIGVIGAGYYEGLDRRLSNKGHVLVDATPCQILGRVCMNITIIDLTNVPNPYVGQECTIFSSNPQTPNSLNNAAKICHTIPYDLLVKLNETVRREVVE